MLGVDDRVALACKQPRRRAGSGDPGVAGCGEDEAGERLGVGGPSVLNAVGGHCLG